MTVSAWREEPIDRQHDRAGFDCGVRPLNEYLRRHARQNHQSGGAKTFVAMLEADPARILGFYSISIASVEFARVPAVLTRKLGRYEVPVFRLARLAVDKSSQRLGLGAWMLGAACDRTLAVSTEVGGVALAIDAKDADAARWYERFGAVPLLDDPLKLFIPMALIAEVATIVRGSAS